MCYSYVHNVLFHDSWSLGLIQYLLSRIFIVSYDRKKNVQNRELSETSNLVTIHKYLMTCHKLCNLSFTQNSRSLFSLETDPWRNNYCCHIIFQSLTESKWMYKPTTSPFISNSDSLIADLPKTREIETIVVCIVLQ